MKKIISIIVTLFFALGMMAQPPRDHKEGDMNRHQFSPEEWEKKMENFITTRAHLTEEEASKFFPLYREMLEAQRAIGNKKRKMQNPGKELTEEQAKQIIFNMTEMEVEHKNIEQHYFTKKFPKVLSWKKILWVRGAMQGFKMEALRSFSPQRNNDPNKGPRRERDRRGPRN